MLSYKEYKQLNESLYGAINLGIKSPSSIVDAPIGATGATEVTEVPGEELEEAKMGKCKCGKMMKKGMDCDCEKDHSKEKEEEDHEDEKEEDHEDDEVKDEKEEEEEVSMMKKKAKKEWTDILADFESLLEGKDENVINQVNNNLEKIRKLLETKEMSEDEKAWWASVNSQLGSVTPGDLGFAPVGKITQALR